jgi:hypothetical protein
MPKAGHHQLLEVMQVACRLRRAGEHILRWVHRWGCKRGKLTELAEQEQMTLE